MNQEPSNATRWTLIARAQGSGAEQRAALEELLRHYEKFVVWLIRRHGHPSDTTPEELKQEFLEGVFRRNDIGKRGRAARHVSRLVEPGGAALLGQRMG